MPNQFGERSILYNLKPINLGTKYVESLTSYIMRIAYEHNVTIGNLINKQIVPQVNKDYLTRSGTYGGNRFYEGAKTINGYMENSSDLVKVMEKLTSRSDLSDLTLNKWKDFIALRNLLKDSLSWCPECINKWRSSSMVYYPLIWHIKPVKICIEHNCFLLEECQVCHEKVDILRRQILPGYCSKCFASLSLATNNEKPEPLELKWQRFIIHNLENILTLDITYFFIKSPREQILNQLNIINEEYFLGNISDFSKFLNIPKSTLRCWLSYENFPALESLLFICFKINKNISDLLFENEIPAVNIYQIDNHIVVKKKKVIRKPLDIVVIEKKLKELLRNDPVISMSAAANKIGHDKRVLYRNFPDLCKQISKRYREFVDLKSNQRVEMLKVEINKAFISLINEEIYPSRRKIEQRVNKKGLLKEKVLQEYWKSLLAKSGFAE
ncbi:TniQ family protein [Robertmurraya massiliosenegalensis]|uniref:TniQ family protein n=1 Tax=Robertmurraya TaxID=2837507 RepID=UPI0039A4FA31